MATHDPEKIAEIRSAMRAPLSTENRKILALDQIADTMEAIRVVLLEISTEIRRHK